VASSNAFTKFSSLERPVERCDISWLYGCLHEDQGIFLLLKKKTLVSPRFVADGAVALVAPGAKRLFETGLGGGRERRLVLPLILGRCRRTLEGLTNVQELLTVLRAPLTDHEMEPEFDAGRDREHPVHGLGH